MKIHETVSVSKVVNQYPDDVVACLSSLGVVAIVWVAKNRRERGQVTLAVYGKQKTENGKRGTGNRKMGGGVCGMGNTRNERRIERKHTCTQHETTFLSVVVYPPRSSLKQPYHTMDAKHQRHS